jgi:hypothetical protein
VKRHDAEQSQHDISNLITVGIALTGPGSQTLS